MFFFIKLNLDLNNYWVVFRYNKICKPTPRLLGELVVFPLEPTSSTTSVSSLGTGIEELSRQLTPKIELTSRRLDLGLSVQLIDRVGQLGDIRGHTLHMSSGGLLEQLLALFDLHGRFCQAFDHILYWQLYPRFLNCPNGYNYTTVYLVDSQHSAPQKQVRGTMPQQKKKKKVSQEKIIQQVQLLIHLPLVLST